jgi:hypothetical protein
MKVNGTNLTPPRWKGSIKDKTKNKLKFGNLFLTFVSSTINYFEVHSGLL